MTDKLISLIEYLNNRTEEYDKGQPTISDKEWDEKYFELVKLEKELNIYYPNSPTQNIDYKVISSLEKVEHNHEMLSLDKTKDIEVIKSFVGNISSIAMLKMDGLTCSLTYEHGRLVRAETRGNGIIGENILHNAQVIKSIPNKIPYDGSITIDGEIICKEKDFEPYSKIYKNPRNFAAGSIRLLDSKECANRNLSFIAWDVIYGLEEENELSERLEIIGDWGFEIVPYVFFSPANGIPDSVAFLTDAAHRLGYPIDGIVFKFNDVVYREIMGKTTHHFKNAMAYKLYDEAYETKLLDIDWTMGRTGQLTPIAIFEPIDIDGSTVERASLHNITVMKELLGEPYFYQKVEVFKANAIIPQVLSADKDSSNCEKDEFFKIPAVCPVCGGQVEIRCDNDSEFLYCIEAGCEGKLVNKLNHFCGKKGLDIKGLSIATLEKLIEWEWVNSCEDVFNLKNHRSEWIKKPGFGEKSVDNVLAAIENARYCELSAFISSLGIPLIGSTVSKFLGKKFEIWEKFIGFIEEGNSFEQFDGFGPEMNNALLNFNYVEADRIYNNYIEMLVPVEETSETNMSGLVFVITGKLTHFKNRDELKNKIEACGGKVAGSISSKTNYLINNDVNSNSSKNTSAKKLNIPIISEKEFLDLFKI